MVWSQKVDREHLGIEFGVQLVESPGGGAVRVGVVLPSFNPIWLGNVPLLPFRLRGVVLHSLLAAPGGRSGTEFGARCHLEFLVGDRCGMISCVVFPGKLRVRTSLCASGVARLKVDLRMTYISVQNGIPVAMRRVPSRPVPEKFSQQQRDFLMASSRTSSHLFLRATAGSGKTTTLAEAAWHLPVREGVCYFAYNRDAVRGVAERLPPGIRASTFHAHGRGMVLRARGGRALHIDEGKTLRLVELVLGTDESVTVSRSHVRALVRAWDQAREALLGEESADEDLAALALAADCTLLQGPEHIRLFLTTMKAYSLDDFDQGGDPDFADLLWLPLQLGLERGSVLVALVDEGQDLTPLRQRFATHLIGLGDGEGEGRLILVFDSDQAIYRYAGARPDALMRLASDIGAQILPLSVSFRCPRSHVRLARRVSSFIEPSPGAALGRVEHVLASGVQYSPGETVLCRTNAPLVRLALDLLSQGVKVNLRDTTVLTWLETAAQTVFGVPVPLEQLEQRMAAYEELRTAPYKDAVQDGDRQAKLAVWRVSDLCDCLLVLAGRAGRRAARVGAQAVVAELRRLFGPSGDVLLTTVHGAKGLEWDRVTILHPERLRLENGDPAEEDAVTFVALTRCRDRLRLAYSEAAFEEQAWAFWEPGPGVYVQVESRMVPSQVPGGHDVRVSSLSVRDLAGFDARRSEALAARSSPEPLTRERSVPPSQVDWLAVVKRSFQGGQLGGHEEVQAAPALCSRPVRESHSSRWASGPTMEELRAWAAESRRGAEERAEQRGVHPVFQGWWVMSASELAGVLRRVASSSRKGLSVSAEAALVALAGYQGADVKVDQACLSGMVKSWDYTRDLDERWPDPEERVELWPFPAVMWNGEQFVPMSISSTERCGGVITTNVDGCRLRFDEASGELTGVAFNPFNPHLTLP